MLSYCMCMCSVLKKMVLNELPQETSISPFSCLAEKNSCISQFFKNVQMYAKHPGENLLFSSSLAEGDATNSLNNTVKLEEERIKGACGLFDGNKQIHCLPAASFSQQSSRISMIIIPIVYKAEMFQFNALLMSQAIHLIRQ